ncbi:MAG: MFS transporter [Micrococcales bacterium]
MSFARGPWVMAAGAFAYLIAVTNRSSLGVATLEASERFDVTAAQLSTLAVAQLAVYAAMQVPVGLLLDRFGARLLLVFGSLAMSLGQGIVAFSDQIAPAVGGRMLLGMGDAFVFISMIRLVNGWYSGAAASRRQQLLTNVGQLGQAVSAIPFSALLHDQGWSSAFSVLAIVTLLLVVVSIVVVKNDRDSAAHQTQAKSLRNVAKYLLRNSRHPAVRMAFWTHFTLQSATSVFILLWGYPFLVNGQGFSREAASLIIGSFVIMGFIVGPFVSTVCSRYPHQRDRAVIIGSVAIVLAWSMTIFGPESVPIPILVFLIVVLSSSAPFSMIAFDYTRSFVSKASLGATNGLVNIGGFLATFSAMFAAGFILDVVQEAQSKAGIDAPLYSTLGFRWAMSVQFLVVAIGLTMYLVERGRLRIYLLKE